MIENEDMIRILGCIPQAEKDQLNMIGQAIRSRKNILDTERRLSFKVNDRVSWLSKKRGKEFTGVITKINRKNILVDTDCGMEWTVHPSFLVKEVFG